MIENSFCLLDLGFGNIMLRDNPTHYSGSYGTRYVIVFQAISSSHTIKFTNWGHISTQNTELVLDDVRLYSLNPITAPCFGAGINNVSTSLNNLNIYPNPSNDKLTIEVENLQGFKNLEGLVRINNILGEVINTNLKMESGKCEVDLKNYNPGIYFVEIKSDAGVMRKRFVKH